MSTSLTPTLADVVAHINHVVKITGVDAVGIGSDFDGVGCVPVDLDSVHKWPNLTRALLEEGYTAEEIRKIYGEDTTKPLITAKRGSPGTGLGFAGRGEFRRFTLKG